MIYNKVLQLNPEDALAYYNVANMKQALGDLEAAKYNLDKALSFDLKNITFLRGRGNINYQLKNTEGACTDWKLAGSLGDKKSDFYLKQYCK